MKRFSMVLAAVLACAAPLFAADPTASPVKEKELVLEGGNSVDRMAVDSAVGRVYIAHAGVVDVVDIAKGERVGVVEGVERAHGIAIVPELKKGFVSAGKNDQLVVFDLETLKKSKEIRTGGNPDAVVYVLATKEIWVFNAATNDVTIIDPATLEEKDKGKVKLPGKPESAVEHPGKGLVYVNVIGDADGVVAIDARTRKILGNHPLTVGVEPTGLAVDPKTGLVFAGCKNQVIAILDSVSWKLVAKYDIGPNCEGVAFDPGTSNAFAATSEVTRVIHVKDAKTFTVQTSLQTPGGKTCALDPKTHRVFVTTGPKKGEEGEVKLMMFLPPK